MPLGSPKYIAAKPRRLTALAGPYQANGTTRGHACHRHTSARYCMSRHTPSATQSTALAQTKHAVPLCEKSWLLCAVKLPQHPLCLRTPCVLHSRVNSVGLAALQPLPTKPTPPCEVANALAHEHTLLSSRRRSVTQTSTASCTARMSSLRASCGCQPPLCCVFAFSSR